MDSTRFWCSPGSTASAILQPLRFPAADGGNAITVPDHQRCDRPRLNDRLARFRRSAEFLGEPYKKSFGPPNVAEPIRVFVLDHFAADKLRAVLTEPRERLVDVVHGEHDA